MERIEAGAHPDDVEATLGMAHGTVDMWLAKHRAEGKAALAAKPVPGRVCRLLKKLGLFPQRPIRRGPAARRADGGPVEDLEH